MISYGVSYKNIGVNPTGFAPICIDVSTLLIDVRALKIKLGRSLRIKLEVLRCFPMFTAFKPLIIYLVSLSISIKVKIHQKDDPEAY